MFAVIEGSAIKYPIDMGFEEIGSFALPSSPSYHAGYLIASDGIGFHGIAQHGAHIEGPTELVASGYAPFETHGSSCEGVRSELIAHFK